MPCPQDARSAAIRGQIDLARTKVRAAIILTSYFCAFGTIPDPGYEFMTWIIACDTGFFRRIAISSFYKGGSGLFQEIFGELASGRVARGAYFKYTALLSIFIVLIFLYAMSSVYMAWQGVSLDWHDIHKMLNPRTAPDFDIMSYLSVDILVFGAVILFAQFNLAVKRVRDTGLPVHWVLPGLFFLYAFSPVLFSGVLELFLLVLGILPTDSFRQSSLA